MATNDMNKNGLLIIPMNDFWVDCYTTAIYSVLLSFCKVKKAIIYRNSYEYMFDYNKKNMGRVYIKTDIEDYINGLLILNTKHVFSKDKNIITSLKRFLDQNQLVMLGIDMYYGVQETSQWRKHHIHHYIIVERYDDNKKRVAVLETTSEGYKEYYLSYDDITLAACEFDGESQIYTIDSNYNPEMYSIDQIKSNSVKICNSIRGVIDNINNIWHVEEKNIKSMRDEVEVHLKSMANRQKVNYLLFEALNDDAYKEMMAEFKQLELEYYNLRETFIDLCNSNRYFENENKIRECFLELLKRENKCWENF